MKWVPIWHEPEEKVFHNFDIVWNPAPPFMPAFKNSLIFITIEAAPKRIIHERQIYNALDLLGDVGGLADGLKILFSVILAPMIGTNLVNFISSQVYFSEQPRRSFY